MTSKVQSIIKGQNSATSRTTPQQSKVQSVKSSMIERMNEPQLILNRQKEKELLAENVEGIDFSKYFSSDDYTGKQSFKTNEGYVTEYYPNGKLKRIYAQPQTYKSYEYWRSGRDTDTRYSSFIPHEILFNEQGKVVKEIKRKTYDTYEKSYDGLDLQQKDVFDYETNTYDGKNLTRKEERDYSETYNKYSDRGTISKYTPYIRTVYDYSQGKKTDYPEPNRNFKDIRESTIKKNQEEAEKRIETGLKKYNEAQTQLDKQKIARDYGLMWNVNYNGKSYNTINKDFLPKEYKEDLAYAQAVNKNPNTYYFSDAVKQRYGITEGIGKGSFDINYDGKKITYNPYNDIMMSGSPTAQFNTDYAGNMMYTSYSTPQQKIYGTLTEAPESITMKAGENYKKILGDENYYYFANLRDRVHDSLSSSYLGQLYNKYITNGLAKYMKAPFDYASEGFKWANIPLLSNIGQGMMSGLKIGLVDYPVYATPYALTKFGRETLFSGGLNLFETYEGIKKGMKDNPIKTLSELGTTFYLIPKGYEGIKKWYSAKADAKGIPKEFRAEYKAYTKALNKLRGSTRSEAIVKWNRVEAIKEYPNVAPLMNNLLKNNPEAVLGGSTAIEAWGTLLKRKPQDIEIYLPNNAKITNIRNQFVKALKKDGLKQGTDFKIVKGDIHFKVGNTFKEGLTFHTYNQMMSNIKGVKTPLVPEQAYIKSTTDGVSIVDPVILALRSREGAFSSSGMFKGGHKQVIQRYLDEGYTYKQAVAGANLETYFGKLDRYSKDAPRLVAEVKNLLNNEIKLTENYPPIIKQIQQYRAGQGLETIKPYEAIGNMERVNPTPYYTNVKTPLSAGLKYVDWSGLLPLKMLKDKRASYGGTNSIAEYNYQPVIDYLAKYPYSNIRLPTYNPYNQEQDYIIPYAPYNYINNNYIAPPKTPYSPELSLPYPTVPSNEFTPSYPTIDTTYTGTPYSSSITKTPTETIITKSPPRDSSKRKARTKQEDDKKTVGYSPVFFDEQGNTAIGYPYASYREAVWAGAKEADETPLNSFNIKQSIVDPEELRRMNFYKGLNKFKKKGNSYTEKRYNRFDKPLERQGGYFNIMPYVFSSS